VLEKKMSRVSILQYTLVLLRIQTTNDFEKIVFLNSKRGEKKKQKTQKTREMQKKKDEIFEILPLRLRVVFDAFPPFRLLFPRVISGSSSHSKSSSSWSSSSSFFFAFVTLFLLVPAAGKVLFFFFFASSFCASFFSPKHLGDDDASTTMEAVILDGLESGISGVVAFLLFLSSSFSLVLVRSFNLLFFVVVNVVRLIFREDILKMFLKNDFQTNARIKE